MRVAALIAALVLASCGPQAEAPAPDAEVAMTSGLDLSGHLIARGADFRLDSAPDIGVVLVYPQQDLTVSGPYAVPSATDTGALLESQGISLTLTPGACLLDGATYPMRASVSIPNATPAEGCALIRWDHQLLDLIPAIDACIADARGARWVTYAGEYQGATLVRLQGEGQSFDCRISQNTAPSGQPVYLTDVRPRDEGMTVAGEGEALFVRGSGGPNPGGECAEAPEVRNASGELVGWMMDPLGC
jgi:hypothetical protein